MINSLYSGITGLNAATQRMGVIGDNIANVNTTAYKGSELSFESLIMQSVGGYTGQEIGGGVMLGDLSYDWNQGTMQKTSNPLDMAIAGSGFFQVQDPADANKLYYTRDGEFSVDPLTGYLVTSSGMRVMGCDPATTPPVATPILVPPDSATPSPSFQNVSVDAKGIYTFTDSDTTLTPTKMQIVLFDVTDKSSMAKMNSNLYKKTTDATDPLASGFPGTFGLGAVEPGSLEMSNVDIAKEFVNMITAQRAFSASSKVITTSDEILQELISLKR